MPATERATPPRKPSDGTRPSVTHLYTRAHTLKLAVYIEETERRDVVECHAPTHARARTYIIYIYNIYDQCSSERSRDERGEDDARALYDIISGQVKALT